MKEGLLTVLVVCGFIWLTIAMKTKKSDDERVGQKALVWAMIGGFIGSFFGIAGFGGAISGAIPGAIIAGLVALELNSKGRNKNP